jgi:hypothetical protein
VKKLQRFILSRHKIGKAGVYKSSAGIFFIFRFYQILQGRRWWLWFWQLIFYAFI